MKTLILIITFLINSTLLFAQNTSSIRFDGVDDHVYIGTDAVFNISDSITLEAWVKCDSIQTNNFARIIDKLDYANKKGFNIRLDYGSVLFQCFIKDGTGLNVRSTKKIRDNKWHHIAGTYDGQIMRLYLDGKLVDIVDILPPSLSMIPSNRPLTIAKSYDSSTANPFKGYIDEVRIWNIARDSSQIRKDKDSCLSGNEKSLISYWRFNENKDTVANDKSKYNNAGILRNGAAWSNNVGFKELCKTNGMDWMAKQTITINPNPISENSIIDLGNNFKMPVKIDIFNSQGQLVYSCKTTSSYYVLNKNDYQQGLYYIRISNETRQSYYSGIKFIVN